MHPPISSRFIPACAGNAQPRTARATVLAVHPRMRGERETHDIAEGWTTGSSPHARGTRIHSAPGGGLLRFIPACAGNAYRFPAGSWAAAVHPRMRGERPNTVSTLARTSGSSPHARGTRLPVSICASVPRVHPRMRGERMVADDHSSVAIGSSPHARGTHATPVFPLVVLRFIPACAGNASLSSSSITPMTVHPRMRGERVDPLHDHDDG